MVGRRVILALTVVVGLGLSACSSSGSTATPAATQPTTPSTAPATTTTTTPPVTAPDASATDLATRDPFEPQG